MAQPKGYTLETGAPARTLWWDTRRYSKLRDDDRVRDCPGCGQLLLSADTDPERLRKHAMTLPPVVCPKCSPDGTRK